MIGRKKPHPSAVSVFSKAFAEGLGWQDVLERAGVSRDKWRRIAKGFPPRLDYIDAIHTAIDSLIAENPEGANPDPE